MFKFCVLLALAACVFAETFTPSNYPCSYHYSYPWHDDENNTDVIVHEYGQVSPDRSVFYWAEIGFDAENEKDIFYFAVIRSDLPREGGYLRVDFNYDPEEQKYVPDESVEAGPVANDPFEFSSTKSVECPSGENNCNQYCNDTYCVVVNAAGLYVVDPDGWNVTWYNDGPTADRFAFELDGTKYDAPTAICQPPYAVATPDPEPCPYHVSYTWVDEKGRKNTVHERGMMTDDVFYVNEQGFDAEDETHRFYTGVIRGDKPKQDDPELFFAVFHNEDETCDQGYEGEPPNNSPFPYMGEPKSVECPDHTTGCTKYVNVSGGYVIVNAKNNYVVDPDGWILTRYEDTSDITVDMFAITDCDQNEIPAPANVCPTASSGASSGKSSSGASGASSGASSGKSSSAASGASSGASSGKSSSAASGASGASSGASSGKASSGKSESSGASAAYVSLCMVVLALAALLF